ncbi:MAG: energy transducer TonB [Elusimicrobia bacterium]|nr:energy transducer TonB [Candidatus Liberimonas magnetica]
MPIKLFHYNPDPITNAVFISVFVHFCVIAGPSIFIDKNKGFKDYTLVDIVDSTKKPRTAKRIKNISMTNTVKNEPAQPAQAVQEIGDDEDSGEGTEETDYSGYLPFFKVLRLPEFKVQIKPVYPAKAKLANVEAMVIVEVYIDAQGRPRKALIIKSGGDDFDKATIEAVSNSQFTPAISKEGQAVPVRVRIPFKFELE